MNHLQFQEEQYTSTAPRSNRNSKIVNKLISLGLAKNAKQANYILFGVLAVLLIITFMSLSSMRSEGPTYTGDPNIDPDTGETYDNM